MSVKKNSADHRAVPCMYKQLLFIIFYTMHVAIGYI